MEFIKNANLHEDKGLGEIVMWFDRESIERMKEPGHNLSESLGTIEEIFEKKNIAELVESELVKCRQNTIYESLSIENLHRQHSIK